MNFAVDTLTILDESNACIINDPVLEIVTASESNNDSFESGVISNQGKQIALLKDTVSSEGGFTCCAEGLVFDIVGGFGDVDHLR